MSKLNGFPQGGSEPLSSANGAKSHSEPTGWILDEAERGSTILLITMWENTFRADPEFRGVIRNFLRQLLGEGAYEQRGDNSASTVTNGHHPEPAAGAGASRQPLSITERRDLLLTLLRIQDTAKEDKELRDALKYFLWQVVVRFMVTGDTQGQEGTPVALLALDHLEAACEIDQTFGAAVRERLQRILGNQRGESCTRTQH